MSQDELNRLRRQQEANAIAIQRLQQNNQQYESYDYEPEQHYQQPQQPQYQQPQYQAEDPNKVMLNTIINEAGNRAANQAADMLARQTNARTTIESQMKDLVSKYPSLKQDDSPLVQKAREIYGRVKQENATLPEHVIYRMAVNEAATYIGARPTDAPIDDLLSDFTQGADRNPALPKKSGGSLKRLTSPILQNAQLMGINIDKNTPEGKKNLEELAYYTARFNADKDESEFGYR